MTDCGTAGRVGRLLLVALLVLLVTAAPQLSGRPPDAGAAGVGRADGAQDPNDPVRVDLTELQPLAPGPKDTLLVAGRLTNVGDQDLGNVTVQLRVDPQPLVSRGAAAAAVVPDPASSPRGDVPLPNGVVRVVAGSFPPGASTTFRVSLPVADLGLAVTGVYPLALETHGTVSDGSRVRVATVRTLLPFVAPGTTFRPTRVAVLWPVTATPTRAPRGAFPTSSPLPSELAGRLTRIVSAGTGEPVTWMLDGNLVEAARELADGAPQVAAATAATSAPLPAAATWLDSLTAAVSSGDVVSLGYADPDLVSVWRAGLSADLTTSASLGAAVLQDVLGRSVTSGVDWPAEGTAPPKALRAAEGAGARAVVLSGQYAAPSLQVTYTPSAVGPLTGTHLQALVSDPVLSQLFVEPAESQGGPVLARQRFVSELAMVNAELPADGRSVVVAPPRGWDPDVPETRELLSALGAVPWARPTTLDDLRATSPDGPSRRTPVYPESVRRNELSADQMTAVREGRSELGSLAAVLTDPQPLVDQYERALLRAESAAWRDSQPAGTGYAQAVRQQVRRDHQAVRIVPSGPVTLTSRTGRIPVTVDNGLDQEVTVQVAVAAIPSVRMTLGQPGTLTVGPGRRESVEVPAEAAANGRVVIEARLMTPEGRPYGSAVTFPVRATGIGQVAQLIVGVALVLLTVALVFRVARTIRRGRPRVPTAREPDVEKATP